MSSLFLETQFFTHTDKSNSFISFVSHFKCQNLPAPAYSNGNSKSIPSTRAPNWMIHFKEQVGQEACLICGHWPFNSTKQEHVCHS
jgi:hypothetical protein